MKRKMFMSWCYLLTLLFFTSCSDDDQKGWDSTKEMRVYGLPFQLSNGVIWHNNDYRLVKANEYVFNDTYVNETGESVTNRHVGFTISPDKIETGNFMLSLYEEGLSFNPILKTAQGKGACICFHFASSDKNKLTSGKYKFSDSKEPLTFIAYSLAEYNAYADNQNTQLKPAILVDGEAEVIEEGNGNYQVIFRCETSFKGVVEGRYNGQLAACDIKRNALTVYKDTEISALLDSIKVVIWLNGNIADQAKDLDLSNSVFYSTTSNSGQNAETAKGLETIDVALVYDKKQDAIQFESPIKMAAYLDHKPDRTYPCHTKYMNVPADFTNADFNKLANGEATLDFTMEENQSVQIPLNTQFPKFVFFETGKGVKGVFRINEIKPSGIKSEDIIPGVFWVEQDVGPQIVADIICTANFPNERLK